MLNAELRTMALFVAVLGGFAILFSLSLKAGESVPGLVALPALLMVGLLAGLLLLHACMGSVPATCAFLFALAFVNDALFRVREPGDIGLDWQNGLKFMLWGGAACIGLSRWTAAGPMFARPTVIIALCYLVIAVVSAFYSAAPTYSFGTAFGMLSMLLVAGALSQVPERLLLLWFSLSLALFVIVGWGVYFAIPQLGRSPFITADGSLIERICGLAGQANALGCVLAVYLGLVFLMWYRGHYGLWVVAPLGALGLFTLLAADSRTALLAWMAAVAAVLARRSLWTWGGSLLAGSLGVILVAGVPLRTLAGMSGGLSRSGDPTELFTLTGRTEIWAFVWDKILLQPWFGYGYNSSKFILPQFLGLPGLQVDEAHNTWLQNLLGTGIVGTAPLVLLVAVQLVLYVRAPDPFRDLFLFMALVWGVTVAGAFGSTPTVMTLAVFISLLRPAWSRPALSHPALSHPALSHPALGHPALHRPGSPPARPPALPLARPPGAPRPAPKQPASPHPPERNP